MSKGSAPAGNTTVTQNTVNPTQQVQLPYLTGQAGANAGLGTNFGWDQAVNLAAGDPFQYYPGQTLATQNPAINAGYQGLINSGYGNFGAANAGNNAFLNGVGGGYSVNNSPAFNLLTQIGNGAWNPGTEISQLDTAGNNAAAGNSSAMNQLAATANGAYLGANPYLAAEYQAAAQPVINAYQTATAPQTDSNFEAAGRYGSGAQANAQSQNQLDLGTTLGNLSANLYGQDYANERGLQTNAASALGGLQNQNLSTAGGLYGAGGQLQLGQLGALNTAGSTLQSGFQAGNTAANQALLMEPNVLSGNLEPNQAVISGGQGLTSQNQLQIQDLMNRFYGNQQAPWTTNEQYLNQIGQPTSGSANQQTTSPYFQNGLANILGAGVGGLGLFNGLNTATGGSLESGLSSALGGIFGSGAGAADIAALNAASAGGTAGFLGDSFGGSLLGLLGAA